jgi:hypothetical protein
LDEGAAELLRINIPQWIPLYIRHAIPPSVKPNRVRLRIPPHLRVIAAVPVVMQPVSSSKYGPG